MAKEWPSSLSVVQIRFARPTGQMDEVTAFYREGRQLGYTPSAPRNTYWAETGVTVSDPDGWNVVLMNTLGFGDDVV